MSACECQGQDLNQAVTVTFDPPLEVDGCHCWQLLRNHDSMMLRSSDELLRACYTTQTSEDLAFQEGFILVAMKSSGSNFVPACPLTTTTTTTANTLNSSQIVFYFAAPNPRIGLETIMNQPLSKNVVALVPFCPTATTTTTTTTSNTSALSSAAALFTWNVTRFSGGGISFHTTMETVKNWFARHSLSTEFVPELSSSSSSSSTSPESESSAYCFYLTDDARLMSEKHTNGNPLGFGMNLAYPAVVDVTCLLDLGESGNNGSSSDDHHHHNFHHKHRKRQHHCSTKQKQRSHNHLRQQIERTKRFLIDAAIDCGFFFAVIRIDAEEEEQQQFPQKQQQRIQQRQRRGQRGLFVSSVSATTTTTAATSNSPSFISALEAHEASQRLMEIIRNVFGRSISAKKRWKENLLELEQQQNQHEANNIINANVNFDGSGDDSIEKIQESKSSSPLQTQRNPPAATSITAGRTLRFPDHFTNVFPIDEQLTKVTLMSTTGEVKTSFNPPRFAKIELPEWMKDMTGSGSGCDEADVDGNDDSDNNQHHLQGQFRLVENCCSSFYHQKFVPEHFLRADLSSATHSFLPSTSAATSDTANHSGKSNDLVTHFRFGEELAARMVGILFKGIDPEMTQWPPDKLIRSHPKTYKDTEVTKISSTTITAKAKNNIFSNENVDDETRDEDEYDEEEDEEVDIARVDPTQFYTLFRAVCYPPSTRTHHKKLKKLLMQTSQGKGDDDVDDDNEKDDDVESDDKNEDEEVEYVYEEVEEAEHEEDERGAKRRNNDINNSNNNHNNNIYHDDDDDDDNDSHKSSDTDDSQGKGLYEHTDKTWITLLTACPSLHGLEVVDCDGSTFTECCTPEHIGRRRRRLIGIINDDDGDDDDADHGHGHDVGRSSSSSSSLSSSCSVFSFICNVGDALQMVSNGKYISRTHRARNPNHLIFDEEGNEAEGIEKMEGHDRLCCCQNCRISLPLFVEPSPFRWPRA